jgi:anthranilate phosphoribosyltransferase
LILIIEEEIPMIQEAIVKLSKKEDLSYEQSYAVLDEIMSGATTQVQTTAFLVALSMKGETIDEISGCAAAMRDHATPVKPAFPVLEIVGTGGDRANSFNISSTAAMVIAAAGQPVAKHGNRAASSRSGAADCLEALGVSLDQGPDKALALLEQVGLCFFFAQKYHTSMKYVGPIRKELGIRTVFNLLGPLTNPASPAYQVLGVYDESLLEPMADVLAKLGVQKGLVVYNRAGMDELAPCAVNAVCEFENGEKKCYDLTAEELGLAPCTKEELVGGTPEENAQITRDILSGKPGPKRDTVLLNAGAALYIAGKADTIADGVRLAAETIDSGKAAATLDAYIAASNQ